MGACLHRFNKIESPQAPVKGTDGASISQVMETESERIQQAQIVNRYFRVRK